MRVILLAAGVALLSTVSTSTCAANRDAERAHGPGGAPSSRPAVETRRADHPLDAGAEAPDSGAEMLGRPAPAWSFTRWIGTPLSLDGLRGKVVLLRWWTEGCHFCASTLPGIESLRRVHTDDGLVVIGAYHPKPPREVGDRKIAALAKRLGFAGRIAVDRDWRTLDRYWLAARPERSWTSVSFLVDRQGLVRWVHGGGEYHPSEDAAHARCAEQHADLMRALARALAEP
jgi:thiol-disulfide isomerase/thioredoxin